MAENNKDNCPTLSVESVSAVFAHDISTPLMTAKMNADLLNEYQKLIVKMLETPEAEQIPTHIKLAIEHAPGLIQNNVQAVQASLEQYKNYLNSFTQQEPENNNNPPLSTVDKVLKVLLVDDEDIHHDIADAALSAIHNLIHEKDGETTIERCKTEEFDVVLMDMQMPGLSGQQTVEQLRVIMSPHTLIIGLSNMPIQAKKQELMDCGFNGFLDKPLKLDRFNTLLSSLFKNSN